MRHTVLLGGAMVLALVSASGTPTAAKDAATGAATAETRPWTNTSLSPDERARLLEARMTLEEKLRLLHGPMGRPRFGHPAPEGALGSAGYVPGIPRLGIPALQEADAGMGITNPGNIRPGDAGTALPSATSVGASWDLDAAAKTGAILGNEAFRKGFNVVLAGGATLIRDPRNGRNFEYYSEDPLLTGELAGASIAALQAEGVASTIKHYALNNQETGRFQADVRIDRAAARESDLLAFQIGIEKGRPASVMCAYNLVEGQHLCGHSWLLNDVLKKEWGYPGWVMSDWGAVHATSDLLNGLDQESGEQVDREVYFGEPLTEAAKRDPQYRARVDDAGHRILRSLFAVGVMDRAPTPGKIDYTAHAQTIREVAANGIVLLKNSGDLLPLAGAKSIVVIGGMAEFGVMAGGGSSFTESVDGAGVQIPAMGVSLGGTPRTIGYHPSSPMKALKDQLPGVEIRADSGGYPSQAAAAAKAADVAIVFATQWTTEGVDAADLTLPNGQDAVIAAVAAANPRTIVVLQTGGAVVMPWLDKVGAVLEAWYPGGRGGEAIADVLTGKVNPGAHLPVSFPRSEAQLPRPKIEGPLNPALYPTEAGPPFVLPYREGADVGYRGYAKSGDTPLFPFGFGLSYTTFSFEHASARGGKQPTVTFTVRNTGKRAGAAVPQVYLTGRPEGEIQRLVGWKKITLAPGESRKVSVPLDRRLFADFDETSKAWRLAGGTYSLAVGHSAQDLNETVKLTLGRTTLRP